jgi:SAM-dependent methyltransferase
MPDVTWNAATWDGSYDWSREGEEWSGPWGSSEAQWFGAIYPRIHRFLPAPSILELAPGFGRWTRFLITSCERYVGVDLSATCIGSCRDRFRSATHAEFFQNDGLDLSVVEPSSVDFAFSFDSLVHVEMNVMESYVRQLLQKLRPRGVAFLHHSNVNATPSRRDDVHHRASSVSYELVAGVIRNSGGKVLVQELIPWGPGPCTDCISLFCGEADFAERQTIVVENKSFMVEANLIREHVYPYFGT